jgi:hypothetical protein
MSNEQIKMSDDLKRKLEHLTVLQKRYAEYRARGLPQSEAALKAGSKGSTKESLGRTGYNMEQVVGVKEYIDFLILKRASAAMVDNVEIIDKLRDTYEQAMEDGKYGDANKAIEHLMTMGGFSGKSNTSATAKESKTAKNNIDAFKEEGDTKAERLKKLQALIKEV